MKLSQVRKLLKEIDRDTLEGLLGRFEEGLIWEYYNQGYGLGDMDEAHQGEYSSDEDFVQEMVESLGEIPESLPAYISIDWERTTNDIMMDYYEIEGHYFRSF